MTKGIWEQLREPFPDNEIKHRPGPGNRSLSYVDARAVAQRLDDVLTPGGWQFTCSVVPGTDIVKGHLEIVVDPTVVLVREDHGYPNSDRDEEPLKAATSDALKRCAVLFGVGRHLYEDNGTTQAGRGSSPRPAAPSPRPAAPPQPGGGLPEEPDWVAAQLSHDEPIRATESGDSGGTCPVHHLAWMLRPGGVSKTSGKPYDPFWACPSTDRPYCKEKPGKAWTARQETAS